MEEEKKRMGALFAKKKVVWVPDNEKLGDKCSYPEGWAATESFKGWKVRAFSPVLWPVHHSSPGTPPKHTSTRG